MSVKRTTSDQSLDDQHVHRCVSLDIQSFSGGTLRDVGRGTRLVQQDPRQRSGPLQFAWLTIGRADASHQDPVGAEAPDDVEGSGVDGLVGLAHVGDGTAR